jgi:hypothetical protein
MPEPVIDGMTVEGATDALLAEGIGDGLPVVPPTAARLTRMLAGIAEPDRVLGLVPPLFGELTAAAAGFHAVLAGCRPALLPVVLTALRACLEPEFNLLGVQTTTGTAAVAVIVHGPPVTELGFNAGSNALGPGNHANATAGRAVALALAGIGGARPGVTDMATTGQPGRYTFCLPERPEAPFPGLAARRGVVGGAITVFAAAGTAEVLARGDGRSVADVLDPVAELLTGAALASGDPGRAAGCEHLVVVPPEVASRLAGLGTGPADLSRYLVGRADALLAARAPGTSAGRVEPIVAGGAGIKMVHVPGWMGGSRSVTRGLEAYRSRAAAPSAT